MKRLGTLLATAVFALLVAVPGFAQEPATPRDQPHPGTPPAGSMPTGAMPAMDMCRHMMGDSMAMPAMGDGNTAPKQMAHMLEMRGEMMKAMGDIMMKHARRMKEMEGR